MTADLRTASRIDFYQPEGGMTSLIDFLTQRLDEDEQIAIAASTHDDDPVITGGEHWRWEYTGGLHGRRGDGVTDQLVNLDTDAEFLDEASPVSLRSVEQYPYSSMPGSGPSFVVYETDEMRTSYARHIARHDPARVLADVQAKRAIIATYVEQHEAARQDVPVPADFSPYKTGRLVGLKLAIQMLAQPFVDHPDFDSAWIVEG